MHSALEKAKEILGGESFPACESASLRLEKFVLLDENSKAGEVGAVVSKGAERIPFCAPRGAVQFVAKLGGRLIVNQAGGILENAGLCLHRHFNAPYIPGSALKGVARHAAWCAWNDEKDDVRKKELAMEIADIFGYPTGDKGLDSYLAVHGLDARRSGSVCFMPAIPETTARLVVDIVNCHHMKYYSGNKKFRNAGDVEKPVPNFFPAVESGNRFVFTLVPQRGTSAERARAWLLEALTVNGVGAKTAAGYGWFSYSQEETDEWQERKRRQEMIEKSRQKIRDLSGRLETIRGRGEEVLSEESLHELDVVEHDLDSIPKEPGIQHDRDALVVACKALDKFRPRLSPEQVVAREWAGLEPAGVVRSRYILCFTQLPAEMQTGVVQVLRAHALWQILRTGNYKDPRLCMKPKQIVVLRGQVESIRAFAKTTPEGKMP